MQNGNDHRGLVVGALMSVLLLVLANLVLTNALATTGDTLGDLQRRKENLSVQNEQLRLAIIARRSLLSVEERARAMGFTEDLATVSLTSQPQVAMQR